MTLLSRNEHVINSAIAFDRLVLPLLGHDLDITAELVGKARRRIGLNDLVGSRGRNKHLDVITERDSPFTWVDLSGIGGLPDFGGGSADCDGHRSLEAGLVAADRRK